MPMRSPKDGLEIRAFRDAERFSAWLSKNHAKPGGVWVRFFKAQSGVASVTYAEALDAALCWGWIDGALRPFDAKSWLRRFTPRRPRSLWSKRNRELAEALDRRGLIRPSGRAQIEAAQKDGRWQRAYDKATTAEVPEDFLRALRRVPGALAFFRSLNRANVYAVCYRLQTARTPELRQKRLAELVKRMGERRPIH
jgi:uncharacterized protein YdeI (YjbR/CyaY-like superfamily)